MRSGACLAALFLSLASLFAAQVRAGDPGAAQNSGRNVHAETDGAGRFLLHNIPPGDYKVEARKEGFFVLANESLNLRAGQNQITLTLKHSEELHEQVQ